jgi:hypothetical protein
MKALKQMCLTISGTTHKILVGKEVPQIVIEYWKSKNQIGELVKSGAISDGGQPQRNQQPAAEIQPGLQNNNQNQGQKK